jgi:hypothetical protein
MIEQWNDRSINKKKNSNIIWPCNLVKSARVLDGKIYIFLDLPSRLEILVLNPDGNIETHLHNSSFPLMYWAGFDVLKMKGGITLYALAHSRSNEDDDLAEYNIYRFFLDKPGGSTEQEK